MGNFTSVADERAKKKPKRCIEIDDSK